MIDAFKNLAAGAKRDVVASERHELEQLIQTARAERAGLDAALVSLRERSASLTPIARSLEYLTQTMTGAAAKLDEIGARLTALDGRTRELERLGGPIQDLQDRVIQSNRVQEMVWSMEQQIAKLSDGMRRAATAEETLARLETLSTETTQRLEAAARLHAETEQQAATLEKRAGSVLESLHLQLEILAIDRTAVDGVDERLRLLDGALGRAEARMGALAGQEKDLAGIARGIESVSQRLEGLLAQSDELAGRQLALDRLHEQLADVDALAKKTETIKNGLRGELDVVQSRQRETVEQTQACEDRLLRVERMFTQLEERRALITVAERKLAGVEARVAEIQQANDDLERRHEAIASREQLVNAIKHEVETVHLISARSRADLDYVSQHRGEVAALKVQVDHLLSRLADTNLEQAIRQLSLKAETIDDVKT